MQVFDVLPSVETRRLTGPTLKDVLTPERVVLIFDHTSHFIYLVQGEHAPLVRLFVAHKLARDFVVFLKGQYAVKSEPLSQILEKMGDHNVDPDGPIKEVFNPNLHPEDSPDSSIHELQISPPDPRWMDKLQMTQLPVFENPKIQLVLDKIKQLPEIPGYYTEMILIGQSVYIPTEELSTFFQEVKVTHKYLKIGQLPEGKFFVPDYSCRLIIENGHLQALEYLRPIGSVASLGRIFAHVLEPLSIHRPGDPHLLEKAFQIPPEIPLEELIKKASSPHP